MWKNSFNLDVIGEKGSAHINGLCKWGPSTLEIRKRKLPSGKPKIKIKKIKMKDPTWKLEHIFFEKLIKSKNLLSSINNLEKEYLISKKKLIKLLKKFQNKYLFKGNLKPDNAVCVIITYKGKMLLQKRDNKNIFFPNYFGLFGGAIEKKGN